MKVLIVSDSHGLTTELTKLRERHQHEIDAIIHCGDAELSADCDELKEVLYVRGNCDFEKRFPNEMVHEINGIRVFITHGHLYNVKMTLMNLYYKAKEVGAKVVCFGHSHIAGSEMIDDVLFVNPGSIYLPRMRREKTYVILEIIDRKANVQFYNIDGTLIPELSTQYELC
jgi:putative phosphoesterase